MSPNFSSSRLVRLLGEATLREPEAPRQDFAERLSQWLSAVDTVKLHAALPDRPIEQLAATRLPNADAWRERALSELALVRASLRQAIATQAAQAVRDAPHELDAGAAPHRKRHLDMQRQMEQRIAPLRALLRQALSQTSARLRQLALLDAAMEQSLSVREQRLMSTVPLLLEKRFERLRQTQADDWHPTFVRETQEMLLAELDARLQPVMGMMDALGGEIETQA